MTASIKDRKSDTLFVQVSHKTFEKVSRVVVMDEDKIWCKVFYQDAWDGETVESLLRDIRDKIAESGDAALPF